MADIWMDVDTALAEVPVNLMPLIDDTDFKTRETAVAYNAAGMDLVWNFVTSAGSFTQTAVTPTTAGTYDWTHQGDGIYTIEIPASGGASINNDTEGYGWFSGVATGVLPWRGPVIGFRAAAINDSLCDTNTTGLLSPTTAGRTLDVTATGAAGIDWGNVENPTTAVNLSATNIDPDQVVASVSGAVASVTAGVTLATNAITAAATAADFTTEVQAGLATAADLATVAGYIDTEVATLITELAKVPKSDGTATWNATALAAIQQEATDALNAYDPPTRAELTTDTNSVLTAVADVPTNAELATALGTSDDAVLAVLGTPAGVSLSADIAAVKAQTAAIEADTQDLQSRTPAALDNGHMTVSVKRVGTTTLTGSGTGGQGYGA